MASFVASNGVLRGREMGTVTAVTCRDVRGEHGEPGEEFSRNA